MRKERSSCVLLLQLQSNKTVVMIHWKGLPIATESAAVPIAEGPAVPGVPK